MTPAQATSPCPKPRTLVYPLSKQIEREALALKFDFNTSIYPAFGSPEHINQQRDTVLRNLEGKSVTKRDALLLGRLSWSKIGTIALLSITAFGDAGPFDTYQDVLERHDMTVHAAAME